MFYFYIVLYFCVLVFVFFVFRFVIIIYGFVLLTQRSTLFILRTAHTILLATKAFTQRLSKFSIEIAIYERVQCTVAVQKDNRGVPDNYRYVED